VVRITISVAAFEGHYGVRLRGNPGGAGSVEGGFRPILIKIVSIGTLGCRLTAYFGISLNLNNASAKAFAAGIGGTSGV
jgi:hypothetical protein